MEISKIHRPLSLAWPLLLVLASAYFTLSFIYLVLANYWPGPYEDYWADIPLIESWYHHTISFDQLIIAHNNSHRILIPRLLFLVDYQLASGTNNFLIGMALLFKVALVYLFNRIMVTRHLTERLLFNTLVIAAVFNSAVVYNTVFNINIQWDMMLLFSLSAITCFYYYCREYQSATLYFALAYLFFFCAALTLAGGFFCLPMFSLMAISEKKYKALFLPIGLFIALFYLTFYVLPISHPDAPTYEMMIMDGLTITRKVFEHFFQLLSVGIYDDYPDIYVYFSLYVLILAFFNIIAHIKIKHGEGNFWVYASIFMVMVMLVTSFARVGWLWTASANAPRFKVLGLFLLIILILHCLHIIRHLANQYLAAAIRWFVIANSAALILLVQYHYFYFNFMESDNNFSTHTFMLYKGADRENGRWLGRNILFRETQDPVARVDTLFRSHGLAYYHNKVIHTDSGFIFTPIGNPLVDAAHLSPFAMQCSPHNSVVEIHPDYGVPAVFSTALDPKTDNILLSSLFRDSYFVLDTNGIVTGYAYIYVDTTTNSIQTFIKGFSNTSAIRYIAEISDNQPRCLYQLNSTNP